jgi:histone-binding protein RBBP4
LKLKGLDQEGYGLSWNPLKKGYLMSGSDDHKACIWDISAVTNNSVNVEPLVSLNAAHSSIIEDVAWNHFDQNIFTTIGDDKKMKIWDMRDPKRPTSSIEGHF